MAGYEAARVHHARWQAAAAWPLAARAQQVPKIYHIGILVQTLAGREHLVNAFKRGLQELGYVEGQDVAFEIRSADGHYDRLAGLATELASLRVAVTLGQDNIPDLFRLETAMPDGNWTATVKFSSEFPLGNESFLLGLFQDKDHWTAATLHALSEEYKQRVDIGLSRKSADEVVSSEGPLVARGCLPCGNWNKFISDNKLNQPIYLRLQRTGHDFVASIRLETSEPDTWVTINKIASLNALGNLVIGFVQTSRGTGQTQATIEWLKIESP